MTWQPDTPCRAGEAGLFQISSEPIADGQGVQRSKFPNFLDPV